MRVFVLLFNARTENEGIHTVKLNDRNVVLMFATEDDATRFGLMLEAQDMPLPSVEAIDSEDVEEFCASAGYGCKLVPEGTLVVPPDQNVEKTDWDPNTKPSPRATADPEEGGDQALSDSELDQIRRRLEGLL